MNLIIDNIPVRAAEGSTLLQAAAQNGIIIPTLCNYADLAPDGSCRFCTVEIHTGGRTRFSNACTERCAAGMEVFTRSPAIVELRRTILQLLLQRHGKSCFSCERAESCITRKRPFCNYDENCYSCTKTDTCELRKYCIEYGVLGGAQKDMWKLRPLEDLGPAVYDRNRCILCRRCLRISQRELGDDRTVALVGRGSEARLEWLPAPADNENYARCLRQCVQACPTGALTGKEESAQ